MLKVSLVNCLIRLLVSLTKIQLTDQIETVYLNTQLNHQSVLHIFCVEVWVGLQVCPFGVEEINGNAIR